MKEQEIKPLVSDERIKSMAIDRLGGNLNTILSIPNLEDDYDHRRNAGIQVRDLYEADRAASRLLIEKLVAALGCGCGGDSNLCRRCDQLQDEVDAFLKP